MELVLMYLFEKLLLLDNSNIVIIIKDLLKG